jgi:hypothetical protein
MCPWTRYPNLAECLQSRFVSKPVTPPLDYVSRTENRFVHFAASQCDGDTLRQIVLGELDVVVDDASHAYEETRASFEFLFPLLSPWRDLRD